MTVFNDQMAAQHMRLWVPHITILAIWVIIHMIVTVRSVCLSDALSFYASDKACGFYRKDFDDVFKDSNKECLIKCSVVSRPSYEKMSSWKHELTKMKINFISTTHRRPAVLKKWCITFYLANTEIDITCKRQERQNKRCDDDTQCADLAHSTCNKTSRLCQCVTGSYHLWETNTCVTAQGIGESCDASIQCKAKTPYSICDTDKKCGCQLGYLELNNSCSPGRHLNDTCTDSTQCSAATSNATCRSGVCACTEGHLAISNTCINDRRLGEPCEDHIQCKAATKHSMCNKNNECSCQEEYVELNDSCVSVCRLKESCDAPIQCSEATANSTCNNKTGVCECIEGHLEISSTCLSVQILLDEIRKNYDNCTYSSGGCEKNESERVYISITNTSLKHLKNNKVYAIEKNDNSSLVTGIGVACFLLGAAICGLVCLIITRNRRTKLRSQTSSEDATEQLSVQVSQQMNSRHVYNNDIRDNEEGNDVYIHLHQDPFKVDVQSDYDHGPQQMTADDDYSHMNTCNKTPVHEPDDYGELN
uniref:EB domain-containing protein n=1 Tax=Magallana gigas TaxID=29159 RepID=A0A8W8M3H8_MAGGI|nr:uncharacterized protein LOC105343533 isoform X1 [Crassostrea gigas]